MSSSISFHIPEPGIWTITGEFAGQIVTQQINITDKGATVPVALVFSSSTITVTSPVGTSLLLTDGTNQLTAVSTGTNTFTIYNMGQWTVSGTLEGYTLNTVTVNVVAGQNYPVELSIQTATLTVTAPAGTVVTVTGGGDTQKIAATSGTAVFQLTTLGSYQVSGTLNGLNSNTVTVDVTAYQPYTATLTIQSATIVVTTLDGVEVTAQNGGTTLTAVASDGQATFQTQTFGNWTISGTLSGYSFSPQTVDVQAYQQYDVLLEPLIATITVTAPAGTEIVAENSTGQQVQGYSDNGTAVLEIYSLDTWTVSGNQNGLVTNVVPVQVTDWTDYPVTLTIWAATITVTTPTGTLVTAQNGATQIQGTASNNQVIFAVQLTGDWLVSAQFDDQTDSETVNVQAEEDYPIRLWVPTIVPTVATGSVVTCTQGQTVLTKTSQSGKVRFYVPALGEWTLNATLNEQSSNTVIVDVQEDRDYPLLLNYTFATITVATVAGTEVTAQNGAIIITQTADSNGEAVFEVATFGTWTVSADFDGELVTADVVVSEAINYDVELYSPNRNIILGPVVTLNSSYEYDGAVAASIGETALVAGGSAAGGTSSSKYFSTCYTVDSALTRSSATPLSVARSNPQGGTNENYVIFAGGRVSDYAAHSKYVDAYNRELVHIEPEQLSNQTGVSSNRATIGNQILIFGPATATSSMAIESYSPELVHGIFGELSIPRTNASSGNNDTYAIFAGGYSSPSYLNVVDAFSSDGTRVNPTPLSTPRAQTSVGHVGQYAIVGGGVSPTSSVVEAYDDSLVQYILEDLSSQIGVPQTTNIPGYLIFAWRTNFGVSASNAYNKQLTKTVLANISPNWSYWSIPSTASTGVGNYALVVVNKTSSNPSSTAGGLYIYTYTFE